MMKMMMRPQPSQFPKQWPSTTARVYLWKSETAVSDITVFVMFGFTQYQIACVGGAGGRAGKYIVKGGSGVPDAPYYPYGGGGGGVSVYSGFLTELSLKTTIVAGASGVAGVDNNTPGGINGKGKNGTDGQPSTYGTKFIAYAGSRAYGYNQIFNSFEGWPGDGGSGNTGTGGDGGNGFSEYIDATNGYPGAVGTPYQIGGGPVAGGYGGNGGGANIAPLFVGTILEGANGVFGSGRDIEKQKGAVFLKVW